MTAAYWLQGDTRTVLADLAAAGIVVDVVIGSPAFLEQREYLPVDHPDKALEMGSEDTPGEFIDGLLDVTEGCERLLAPHGSIAIELGDTSSGSGGAGGDYAEGGWREGQPRFDGTAAKARLIDDYPRPARDRLRKTPNGWPVEKSLCMTPELYRVALAYGFNPLTGRTTPRWRVRNVVDWGRTNPSPGRDGDKFRRASSDLVIACRTDAAGARRYWDGEAVRVPASPNTNARVPKGVERMPNTRPKAGVDPHDHRDTLDRAVDSGTAPMLDWWDVDQFDTDLWVINSPGYTGAHYATFPPALVDPLVRAMCPLRVCTVCGEPSRRMLGKSTYVQARSGRAPAVLHQREGERVGDGVNQWNTAGRGDSSVRRVTDTVGWTDCGHAAWRPGIVLDPFAGSGTTLAVATGHSRTAIGIDLDERNADLARDRVGPLFFHETTVDQLAQVLSARRPSDQGAA